MGKCTNVGTADRAVRAVIGIVALVFAFTTLGVMAGAVWGIVAAVVGVVMLGTAALGMCPAYMPFKISTCNVASR
ncbi:MAG: YgaP family membrane protein [Phycisphaerales bacterium]